MPAQSCRARHCTKFLKNKLFSYRVSSLVTPQARATLLFDSRVTVHHHAFPLAEESTSSTCRIFRQPPFHLRLFSLAIAEAFANLPLELQELYSSLHAQQRMSPLHIPSSQLSPVLPSPSAQPATRTEEDSVGESAEEGCDNGKKKLSKKQVQELEGLFQAGYTGAPGEDGTERPGTCFCQLFSSHCLFQHGPMREDDGESPFLVRKWAFRLSGFELRPSFSNCRVVAVYCLPPASAIDVFLD